MSTYIPKIIRLLKPLSREEKKNVKKLVLQQVGKNHSRLFEYFLQIAEEEATQVIYHKEKAMALLETKSEKKKNENQDKQLRKVMSRLTRKVEDFYIWTIMEERGSLRDFLLSVAVYDRKPDGLSGSYFRSAKKSVDATNSHLPIPPRVLKYQLLQLVYYSPQTPKLPGATSLLYQVLQSFERHFLLRKFCYKVEADVYRQPFNQEKIKLPIEQWDLWYPIFSTAAETWPLLKWLLGLLEDWNTEHQTIVWLPLLTNFERFSPELDSWERPMVMKLILNIGFKQLNFDQDKVAPELFQAIKYCFDHELMPFDGAIEPGRFLNIAIIASGIGEFQWHDKFVREKKIYIIDQKQLNSIESIAWAYRFYQEGIKIGDFQLLRKAYALLPKAANIDPRLGIRVKSLKLRLLFEFRNEAIGHHDFEEEVTSLLRYVREHKIFNRQLRERYKHFASFALELSRSELLGKSDKEKRLEALHEEVSSASNLVLRQWLLDKVKSLLCWFLVYGLYIHNII